MLIFDKTLSCRMTLLVLFLLLALVISFLCSFMEATLLSTPLHFLKVKEEHGFKSASLFIRLRQDIEKPLSAILSMNTIANTIGAAGVGSQATIVFGELYFGIVSAILTILILVVSEIIPKTIGTLYWRQLSGPASKLIRITMILMWPFVMISVWITKLIAGRKNFHTTSREEFSALANIGTDEGIFGEKENILIQNIIRLKSVRTNEIMTPRVVVAAAEESMSLEDFLKNKDFLRFSRIPVFSEQSENITGYILRQNVFEKLAESSEGLQLKDIRRDIVIVHESIPLLRLWETLLAKKEYIALVIDEYGGFAGIVTMEDVVETLLGFEIIDEKDTISDMQEYARERWKMRQIKYSFLDKLKGDSKDKA
jgi:CBS domain containing-hemolysin-like protein